MNSMFLYIATLDLMAPPAMSLMPRNRSPPQPATAKMLTEKTLTRRNLELATPTRATLTGFPLKANVSL